MTVPELEYVAREAESERAQRIEAFMKAVGRMIAASRIG